MTQDGLLKMAELAEASGVSAGTIKHYLREGLLGPGQDIVRTSRNMAWYPPAYVERIRLIKRLQEDRFLPLGVIREVIDDDPARAAALVDHEDRILQRAIQAGGSPERTPAEQLRARYDVPAEALDRMVEIGVLAPDTNGFDPDDVAVVAALSAFRAGGYDEDLGFTVYEMLRYQQALQPLVEEEVRLLLERLAGAVEPDRAAEIISAGSAPLRELVGALHAKLLLAELRRQSAARRDG